MSLKDTEEIAKNLNELNKALEAGNRSAPPEELIKGSVLQVEDLSEIADKYLHAGAKAALSRKATRLIEKYDDGRCFACIYLGVRVKKGNHEPAVKVLSEALNNLDDAGLIHSCLAPIISVDLAITHGILPTNAVLVYVLVSYDSINTVKALYSDLFLEEGEMPKPIEDISVPLAEGEFLACVRTTIMSSMIEGFDTYKSVQKQIDQYIAVLPEGTTVQSVRQNAISDLSLSYDVKFYNPLLKRVKSVETSYTRCAEMIDDKFKQFNVFQGIKYFDADRNPIFT